MVLERIGPSRAAAVAAIAAIAATAAAAGSVGMVAQPLRMAMVWVGLAIVAIAVWPRRTRTWRPHAALAGAVVVSLMLLASGAIVVGLLGVALVLAAFAWSSEGLDRRLLTVTATAAAAFGVYRLALESIPSVWLGAESVGKVLGSIGSAISRKPLWIGATFAGLDMLVLMAVVWVGWLRLTAPPRQKSAVLAAAGIAAAHVVYLVLLASASDMAASLPAAPPSGEDPYLDFYVPPDRYWTEGVAKALPWNLPLLGVVLSLSVAAAMVGQAKWLVAAEGDPPGMSRVPQRFQRVLDYAPFVLAVAIPPIVALAPGTADLKDCRIVALDDGYLDWEKPVFDEYGQASAGTYGMLPVFVESLGGELSRSADLAEGDLHQADVLIVFHPTRMWDEERRRRVWEFVRGGGSLLLVGGPAIPEDRMGATLNQVLLPTSMRFRFDSAMAAAPSWQGVLQTISHPAVSGIGGNNGFGLWLGPSLEIGWPARPLLVGRYGWSDPGCDAALHMIYRFDAGERLGDLVLAAEQQLGKGTIVVLTDPFCLTNEGNAGAFVFAGRLLSYLAHRPGSPQSAWRQVAGLLLCGWLALWLIWRNDAVRTAAAAVALAIALILVDGVNAAVAVRPEGGPERPTPVAYIDGSHLEAYGTVRWGFDDLAGLKLTLMRNGYLPLVAGDLEPSRLARAAMLISIAPAESFSEAERRAIGDFVERGGIFLSMAGAENAGPSRQLLRGFGFETPTPTLLPPPGSTEPRYERNVRSRYLSAATTGSHDCYVSFHAAWPLEFVAPDIVAVVTDSDDRPIIGVRRVGRGKVAVIGDTGFAMNKNLEYVGGEPFGGGYENAHFWRWFLNFLNDRPAWIPPPPPQPASDSEEAAGATGSREDSP